MMPTLPRWLWTLLAGATVLTSAFLLGRYVQRGADQTDAAAKAREHFLHDNADSLRLVRLAEDSAQRARVVAERTDSVARAVHAVVRSRVRILDDSTLAVDQRPPLHVPTPVIATIRTGDDALQQDSLTVRSLHAELASVRHENALLRQRADTLAAALKVARGPRVGFKTGAVLGAAAALAVTHPTQVLRAIRWVVALVH